VLTALENVELPLKLTNLGMKSDVGQRDGELKLVGLRRDWQSCRASCRAVKRQACSDRGARLLTDPE